MAKILDLQANVRSVAGTSSVKRLRKAGQIPAVIYGKTHELTQLEINAKSFATLIAAGASDSVLVNLQIEGAAKPALALVKSVQHDYLRGGVLHVDFQAVNEAELLKANVAVILTGVEAAEKKGGLIEQILHNVEVTCLPKDLPEMIVANVDELSVGGILHLKAVELPNGVSVLIDGDTAVATLKEVVAAA